ncbi:MAG: 4-alpha-glucanotransferase [Gammaproteobacteria bacterium]|nr:4-alpha-glucanotransferase [Gammaproteobacteria bacterium]
MWSRRRAGVLLHPTSLPGPGRFGVLGEDARRFIDLIADAGFTVWQVLPVGPVDSSLSPYLLKSVNAGNPELIDPQEAHFPTKDEFRAFYDANHAWVTPYALFMALRERFDDAPWWEWPTGLEAHEPHSLSAMVEELGDAMRSIIAEQIVFERQWNDLKRYAHERGILIVGDLPFYVDRDSVEVWWHRELFKLDETGRPELVAGVPPDYFSEDGQRWGNPVYEWDAMRAGDYRWWCDRIEHQLQRFDAIRIDHFRALQACWEIPADSPTAREGHWEPVPGDKLLQALNERFGDLPLFAEDLGTITPEVHALRDEFGLPGMLVLQFGFDGMPDNPYLPENHVENAVVYTGTHDNDTTVGWFRSLDHRTREVLGDKLENAQDMPAALIRAAYASPTRLAILPMQDLLSLGTAARMNVPGTENGNWQWRFEWADVPGDFAERFGALAAECGRR